MDLSYKGRMIQEKLFGDTSVGDTTTMHTEQLGKHKDSESGVNIFDILNQGRYWETKQCLENESNK